MSAAERPDENLDLDVRILGNAAACWVVRVIGGGGGPPGLRHMCMCACEKRRRGTKRGAARVAPRTTVHSARSLSWDRHLSGE